MDSQASEQTSLSFVISRPPKPAAPSASNGRQHFDRHPAKKRRLLDDEDDDEDGPQDELLSGMDSGKIVK